VEPPATSTTTAMPSSTPTTGASLDSLDGDQGAALDPSPTDGELSRRTGTSTDRRTWRAGGDPDKVAMVLSGLFALAARFLDRVAAVRGRELRQPTKVQRADVAEPLARIAVRHLPLQALNDDLTDAFEALLAVEAYVDDGPLITWRAQPAPTLHGPYDTPDDQGDDYS
jgi:hypothetical protein